MSRQKEYQKYTEKYIEASICHEKEEVTSSGKHVVKVFFLSLPAAKNSGYISMIQSNLSRSPDKSDFIDVSLLS